MEKTGIWHGDESGYAYVWTATRDEWDRFTLTVEAPDGSKFEHGKYCPISFAEVRASNSLVSTILRGAYGIEQGDW